MSNSTHGVMKELITLIAKALVDNPDAVSVTEIEGEQTSVMVQRGGKFERRDVGLGATSAHEVVVTSGLQEGAVIARNAAAGSPDRARTPPR